MSLNTFLAAVAAAAQKYAGQYGLDPKELQMALLATASVEGGLGDTAGVGDGGSSVGRFQFNLAAGHGKTLLNQGMTPEAIADDAFQADHWAPILAQSLQAMKKTGLTGGEAIRQAAFAAERPAQIYDAGRFNSALQSASSLIGGAPPKTAGGGSSPVDGDTANQIRKAIQDRAQAAFDKWTQSRSQADRDEFVMWRNELESFNVASPEGKDPNDLARQKVENAISLGDFESRQADRLYSRWSDKSVAARQATNDEISAVKGKNADTAATAASYSKNVNGPVPDTRTYFAPGYEDALAKWNSKLGVGNEPSATFQSGIGVPSVDTPGGAQMTPAGDTNPSVDVLNRPNQALVPEGNHFAGQTILGGQPAETDTRNAFQKFLTGPDGGILKVPRLDNGQPEDYPFQKLGQQLDQAVPGAIRAGRGAVAKKSKKWWNNLTGGGYKFGIPGHSGGTMDHPGGPAMINEKGPETMVPQFGEPYTMPGAAQVANLDAGTAVIPAGIPPEEAFYFAKIKQGMAAGQGGGDPQSSPEAQQARANDPQLREKVLASIRKAMAANDAANPRPTPVLTGDWTIPDPWENWRPLTGISARAQPTEVK